MSEILKKDANQIRSLDDKASVLEMARKQCRESLYYLATEILGYTDWDVCHDDLERFISGWAKKKAILLPRGHLKTSLVTISKTVQFILRDANVRILIANQVWDRARDILREIKGHFEMGMLPHLFGHFVSQKWTEDSVVVRQRTRAYKEPTIMTTGVEAETTGGHYDIIFLDDLVGLQNSGTVDQLEKAKRFRRSMVNLLEPGGKIIEIGTRWHLNDTFSDILEKEIDYYDVMVRRVVEDGKIIFPKKFAKRFDRVRKTWLADPTGTCMDYVDHLRASMPANEFSSQYMNEPIDDASRIFRDGDFRYYTRSPEGLFKVMTVDPAITEKNTADKTAIVVMGMDVGRKVYVLDYLAGRWGISDVIRNIFLMWERFYPNAVGMESMGFQRALKYALETEMRDRRQFFAIEELRSPNLSNAKELRIKALEPFYRRGDIFHHETMKGKELERELMTFPKGRNDDLADALAYGLQLMVPGTDVVQKQRVVANSWEHFRRQALDAHFEGKDFFNHG